jgi:hypothetical protein
MLEQYTLTQRLPRHGNTENMTARRNLDKKDVFIKVIYAHEVLFVLH